MGRWNYALVVAVVLILLVALPLGHLAFAHRHTTFQQGDSLYNQGVRDGVDNRNAGLQFLTYEKCIANNQANFGINTADYCNGYLTGFLDAPNSDG
jgi:hypothetical protein